ncbi:MAG: glycosyltransferase family 9 protein [Candidatus Caenarcaniphilales bacterium]|nr:glycosyltransferase family 9 protein [Candidatus Caenarcaniphilales bacterium]
MNPSALKNIAILRHGAIGDVINSLAMVKLLKNRYPQANIFYFTANYNRELLSYVPEINQVCEFEFSKRFFDGFRLSKNLKQKYHLPVFDLFINLQPNWCTRNLGFSIAKNFREYHKSSTKGKVIWQSFTDVAFQGQTKKKTEVEKSQFLSFPLIKLPPTIKDSTLKKIESLQSSRPKLALIIGAGIDRPHKAWPTERWIQFLQSFNQSIQGWDILLVGAQREETAVRQIQEALPESNLINLVNKLTLPETASALELCKVAIGGDTGPMHLAASMGVRNICLFGPTSEVKHRPLNGVALKSGFSCPLSCKLKKNVCSKASEENCMNSITSEMLILELKNILSV